MLLLLSSAKIAIESHQQCAYLLYQFHWHPNETTLSDSYLHPVQSLRIPIWCSVRLLLHLLWNQLGLGQMFSVAFLSIYFVFTYLIVRLLLASWRIPSECLPQSYEFPTKFLAISHFYETLSELPLSTYQTPIEIPLVSCRLTISQCIVLISNYDWTSYWITFKSLHDSSCVPIASPSNSHRIPVEFPVAFALDPDSIPSQIKFSQIPAKFLSKSRRIPLDSLCNAYGLTIGFILKPLKFLLKSFWIISGFLFIKSLPNSNEYLTHALPVLWMKFHKRRLFCLRICIALLLQSYVFSVELLFAFPSTSNGNSICPPWK